MRTILPVFFRTLLVVAIMWGLVYVIPYFVLAPVGLLAGYFLLKTSDDRAMAQGLMIGSIIFVLSYLVVQQIG